MENAYYNATKSDNIIYSAGPQDAFRCKTLGMDNHAEDVTVRTHANREITSITIIIAVGSKRVW